MISEPLIWSGIFIGGFIGVFAILWFAIFINHYIQLKRFKARGANVFEQDNIYYLVLVTFIIFLLVYLTSLVFGIWFLINYGNNDSSYMQGLVFEILFLVFMVLIIILLTIISFYQNTIILVFTNETLLTLNEIIQANNIIQIRRDNNRHWIFINWKDEKQERIREIKLKYNYKVKDYLKNNGLWQEQEQIK